MRGTRRPLGSGGPALSAVAGRLTVILGAVLYGCAFFVPAVGAADGITVEIIKPTTAPNFTFNTGQEYEFEAVAFVEGQELPGGEVAWDWDFGDQTDHVFVNPTTHSYASSGNFTVIVIATYGVLSGQDTLNAAAMPPGVAAGVIIEPTVSTVCDGVALTCRYPLWDPSGWSLTRV